MKTNLLLILMMTAFLCRAQQVEPVRLNSLGFLSGQKKVASIIGESPTFVIKDAATGKELFSGKTTNQVYQKDVDQNVRLADFTEFDKPGSYYVEIQGGARSVVFPIGEKSYNDAYVTAMRAFYLWRCGMTLDGEHNGQHYHLDACHLDDGYEDYIGNQGVKRDGTGGWHDAGDYGKYVVNAGVTVGILFLAWEQFQPQLSKMALRLPETAPGYPEFLKEMKWETDWLLKMQYPDGSGRISHKLTRVQFAPFILANEDKEKRFFTEWSSAATADFVAMMAQAARAFKPYDAPYAQKCLEAAKKSYRFLKENPDDKGFVQGPFKTGGYQTRDADDRLWAAAEMWETTGEKEYLTDFEKRATDLQCKVDENWDWGNVANLGMFTYALSKRDGKNQEVARSIDRNIIAIADQIAGQASADVYGRTLAGRYYWGCNGTIARQTVNLYVAHKVKPDQRYVTAALDAVGHIFGRNYYNRSFVTGLGHNPPMNPHDRRSGADNNVAPWPGYLVGGGHKATDWVDLEASYSHNEIAINWQAPLVFALGWFVK